MAEHPRWAGDKIQAGSTLNWQRHKQARKSVFCEKSATILKHLWNTYAYTVVCFLQLYRVLTPVAKYQKFLFYNWLVSAQCGLSQCDEYVDSKTWKWSTEQMCKLISYVYDQPRGLVVRIWLLITRSRIRFPVLPWGFFLEGEDSDGDHGLG
jgi:hypothetical protein